MLPEISSMTERVFCHFGPGFLPSYPLTTHKKKFEKNEKNTWKYYQITHVYHKWQSYDLWFLRYEAWWTKLFVILDCYLSFYPPNNPENQHFEILKKTPGDIIILYICTINDNYMIYGSSDMKHDGQNFLPFRIICHFGPFFALLPSPLGISSFYTSVPKIMIICYTVP